MNEGVLCGEDDKVFSLGLMQYSRRGHLHFYSFIQHI